MFYICIITSIDYHTLYDGFEIVQADSSKDAEGKAKQAYSERIGLRWNDSYMSIGAVILCGAERPKEV